MTGPTGDAPAGGAEQTGVWEVIRRRRMTRAFRDAPVEAELIDGLVDLARRAPSAGNTAGLRVVVLDGADVGRYWDAVLPPERRDRFPWPGLLRAPVLVVPCVAAAAYVARYGEADKLARPAASAGQRRSLARSPAEWPVPFWFVDGGAAVMALLLGAEAVGLGALFFGLFEQEAVVRSQLAIPADWQPLGVVAVGWPDPDPGQRRPSRSASERRRPPLGEMRYRGTWSSSRPPSQTS